VFFQEIILKTCSFCAAGFTTQCCANNAVEVYNRAMKTALTLLALGFASASHAQTTQPSTRLAVIGDFSSVQVGQAGFCGARRDIPSTQFRAIGLTPGEAVWVRVRDAQTRPTTPGATTCEADAGFVPEAGHSYILRVRAQTTTCTAELFKLVPGGDPVRATLSPPPSEDCPKKP
jgi:hypothetical protein